MDVRSNSVARSPASGDLLHLVDELSLLFLESAEFHQLAEPNALLREAAEMVLRIRKRLLKGRRRYVIAIVGLTNVGKSTLLNALFGADVAPHRNGPCTAIPIEFVYGDQLELTALSSGLQRPDWPCGSLDELNERMANWADEGELAQGNQMRRLMVSLPHPLLADGLVIVDTPGFGAAQVGQAAGSHEASVREYLRDDVSQVFWIVLADQGIGKREMDFYERMLVDACDDVVVTGCEDWDDRDRNRFRQRFARAFGHRLPQFHFVSGLQGLRAKLAGNHEALESAGILALEERIRSLADATARTMHIERSVIQLAKDLTFWLGELRDVRGLPLRSWWRPDSWGRWQSARLKGDLHKPLTAILSGREEECPTSP